MCISCSYCCSLRPQNYIFLKDKYSSSVQYNDCNVGLVINEAKFLLTIFLTCIEFCRRGWSQFVVTKDHTIPEPKENLFVAVNHGSYLWLNATISDIISHKSATTGDICSHQTSCQTYLTKLREGGGQPIYLDTREIWGGSQLEVLLKLYKDKRRSMMNIIFYVILIQFPHQIYLI